MKRLLNTLLAVAGLIAGLSSGQATSSAATITQWRSVKTHSSSPGVELAIVLDPAASGTTSTKPTTETRGKTAATQGVLKVQVDFDGPVALMDASQIVVTYYPTIQNPAAVGSPTIVTPFSVSMDDVDTLSIVFAPGQIPNLGCANITIGAGTFAETITGDTDCNIRSLAGDLNSSGTVTSADKLVAKKEFQADSVPTTPGKAKYDVTLSGSITYADMLFVLTLVKSPTPTAICP